MRITPLTVLIFFLSSTGVFANLSELQQKYQSFLKKYVKDGRVDYTLVSKNKTDIQELSLLLKKIPVSAKQVKIKELGKKGEKAFWINAYNITAMKSISDHYPVFSPKQISGFFNSVKHSIGGERVTLDEIEHDKILARDPDARVHFALVCVARGCPKLRDKPYSGALLEKNLNSQARKTSSDAYFVRLEKENKRVVLSELFRWYRHDFTRNSKTITSFLNQYRKEKIPSDFKVEWKDYDWTLNDTVVSTKRFKYFDSSSLLNKGGLEIKSYNWIYTEAQRFNESFQRVDRSPDTRVSYFGSLTGFYYGISDRWNLGLDLYIQSVRDDPGKDSPFRVLGFESNSQAHAALTNFVPKVKFAPLSQFQNLSMQLSLLVPVSSDLQGIESGRPFLEYDAWQLWYEIYYDHYIGESYSIFLAGGFFPRVGWMTTSGFASSGYFKAFFQYFWNDVVTLYTVTEIFGLILNGGIGAKFLVQRAFQIDVLFSHALIGPK